MIKKRQSSSGKKRPAGPSIAQAAFVALMSTADRLRAHFETVYAPFEITGQQYNVLRILRGAGPDGLPTLMIAERMIERTPGITRMIDRLEAKGLVVREIRPEDRRCVHCCVTQKGLNLLEMLDGPVEEGNHVAFAGLSVSELEQLVTFLEKVRKAHDEPRESLK